MRQPALDSTCFAYQRLVSRVCNPLQDLAGLVVHIGELIDGKTTSHLDLRKKLVKGKAGKYLYYKVLARQTVSP